MVKNKSSNDVIRVFICLVFSNIKNHSFWLWLYKKVNKEIKVQVSDLQLRWGQATTMMTKAPMTVTKSYAPFIFLIASVIFGTTSNASPTIP